MKPGELCAEANADVCAGLCASDLWTLASLVALWLRPREGASTRALGPSAENPWAIAAARRSGSFQGASWLGSAVDPASGTRSDGKVGSAKPCACAPRRYALCASIPGII
eukprot:6178872-Pleurochrysis_carterae.AAC.1